jgi:hypothetical protein
VAVAGLALRRRQMPGTLDAGPKLRTVNCETRPYSGRQALITCVGFNHQINAAALELC